MEWCSLSLERRWIKDHQQINSLILFSHQIDQKAVFDRKDCTIFGWSLEKTDLQYVLELNEPCFVKIEPLPECELDCEV